MESSWTLLLTDLVDSTALNARLGDAAMAAVWDAHDRASRDLARRFGAREVDRSDGFLMLFAQPDDAAAFAAEYHRLLATLPVPLSARAGLHVGAVSVREASAEDRALGAKPFEVIGIAKAVTARLMALARGGQTLASAEAAARLQVTRCVSHGHWRFKGLDEPQHVFECAHDGAPLLPPADSEKAQQVLQAGGQWIGVGDVPRHLPVERDGFVGRAEPLSRLAQRLDEGARLVVLLGPGGIGKTRLALRYGWGWLGRFPGGVFFCDLAAARGADGIAHAVARGLDVPLGADPIAQLGHVIAARGRCLVLLDNFEQVVRDAPATLGAWLDAAPEARFVVTSREALGLAGEHAIALEPLAAADAVALFHARAQAVDDRYDPDAVAPATAHALAALLDGLPLALELAAARVALLPPEQLLARMGQRLRLLSGRGDRPERQATLRAAIEWSWDLLDDTERAVLAQLAVFQGGFTLAAAEAVVQVDSASWLLDLLQSLVAKSLLRSVGGGRFAMLSTIQEFAAERLDALALGDARRRHWRCFAAMDDDTLLAGRCAELDNVVAACRAATAGGDAAAAVATLRLAWAGLRLTGPFRVALALADGVRAMPMLAPADAAAAYWVAGAVHAARGDVDDARRELDAAQAALGDAGAADLMARVCASRGSVESIAGEPQAAATWLARAWTLAQPLARPSLSCTVLIAQGALAFDLGRLDEARQRYEQALAFARELQSVNARGSIASNLGTIHYTAGRLEAAEKAYEEALAFAQASGDRRVQGNALSNLGVIDNDRGDTARAVERLQAALEIGRAIGNRSLEFTVRCVLGLVHMVRNDLPAARRELGHAVDGAETMGNRRAAGEFRIHLATVLSQQGQHDAARACVVASAERLEHAGDRLSLGRLWCAAAENEMRAGDPHAARAALARARAVEAAGGWGTPSPLASDLARAEAAISRG